MTSITYTDGARGTATLETGKHGGATLVLRKGSPVAAEVVAGIKVEHLSMAVLDALGVCDPYTVRDMAEVAALRGESL